MRREGTAIEKRRHSAFPTNPLAIVPGLLSTPPAIVSNRATGGEGGRQRDTERDTERQRDTATERQRDRETERPRDRETETCRQRGIYIGRARYARALPRNRPRQGD